MFKNLILKDLGMGSVNITNVPCRLDSIGIPCLTKGVSEKIKDLVMRAEADNINEIDFSFDLWGQK